MRRATWIVLVSIIILAGGAARGDSSRSMPLEGLDKAILAPSDLLAAFLVAYEEQQKLWQNKGVALTPRELIVRHYAVYCTRNGPGQIAVMFTAASPFVSGGGMTYFVDMESLKVVERKVER